MNTVADRLIDLIGGPLEAPRRALIAAYVGWGLLVVFGCTGLWNGPFTAAVAVVSAAAFLLKLRADELLNSPAPGAPDPGDGDGTR